MPYHIENSKCQRRMKCCLLAVCSFFMFIIVDRMECQSPIAAVSLSQTSADNSGLSSEVLSPNQPYEMGEESRLSHFINESSLIKVFRKGGHIMWPLLMASILAMGTVLERILFLIQKSRVRNSRKVDALLEMIEKGDVEEAIRIGQGSKDYILRILLYALQNREQTLRSTLRLAKEREMKSFRFGIPILDTVITLAPLLGLLGTVTGMMGSFSLIGGELSAPGAITGGIAEALIATAFGLGIAITSLLPFNYLNTKIEKVSLEIDSASTQLEILLQKSKKRNEEIPGCIEYPQQREEKFARVG